MRVAVTVWGNRISPVFDAASALLLVDFADSGAFERELKRFQPGHQETFIALLKENGVQLLLCGAICEASVQRIEATGVEVVPFLAGEVEALIDGYIEGLDFTSFAMPGCRNGRCCRGRYKMGKDQQ